jgi:hypothetical protein
MARQDVGVICSMSYFEMKMLVAVLSKVLLENEVRGENTKKRIFNLISKLNNMLTRQC